MSAKMTQSGHGQLLGLGSSATTCRIFAGAPMGSSTDLLQRAARDDPVVDCAEHQRY